MEQTVKLNTEMDVIKDELWSELLDSYVKSDLTYTSDAKDYATQANRFIQVHHLNKETGCPLLKVGTAMNESFYVFPVSFDPVEKFNFLIGFDNFFIAVLRKLTPTETTVFERANRQASPPLKAYEQVGHNKDFATHSHSDYGYLYE